MQLHGRNEPTALTLVGRWKVTDTDGVVDADSEVTAEFTPDGRLKYAIAFAEKQQLILLTWRRNVSMKVRQIRFAFSDSPV